jgi:putative membrane protein
MEWKNIYRGMVMGISDVIPGVSGGTIAVILGIYDRLIAAINGLFSKEWKKHVRFLMPLAIGIGMAIFLFGRLMNWLLTHHESLTYYFFLGLIVGILPFLFRESNKQGSFKGHHFLFLGIGIIVMFLLPDNNGGGIVIQELSFSTYILLFFAGFLASAAMILPGISGSFVLVVIGVYKTVIHAVSTFDVKILFVVALGIGIGIILMSKVIHYCLKYFHTATFSFIIGLVIGSIYVIFPGWAQNVTILVSSVVVFAGGLLVAYMLGKVEY